MKPVQARRPGGPHALFLVFVAAWCVAACAARTPGARAYPELVRFAGREIEDVDFAGAEPFTEDTLEELVQTKASRCSILGLPICPFGLGEQEEYLDLDRLRADALRLAIFYRQRGFFGTEVEPEVRVAANGDVVVTFAIRRGDPVVLRSLELEGVAGVLDSAALRKRLPLRVGERFDLGEFTASRDTLLEDLRKEGYAYARVLRQFTADTVSDVVDATLTALPGPRVVVDSIAVIGANSLGRDATLKQLTFREGEILRLDELEESERNLYALDIVRYADIRISPDTLGRVPADSAGVLVVVRIVEAPVHVVDASAGFGTVDCLRADVRWTSRSLGGGARRLSLAASVSKVGIGAPLDLRASEAVCREFRNEPFRSRLDYRFAAEFTEPGFMDARNRLTVAAFAERQSEPRIFQREVFGGRLALARRLGPREAGTTSLVFERGRTLATPVIFCTALLICRPEDIANVRRFRWRNALGAAWARDRTDQERVLDPRRGYRASSSLTYAAEWLGSDASFVRWVGDASRYWPLSGDRVLAAGIRVGSFFGTASIDADDDFLPPEDRFYAGGATSVRGFARNGLGPVVYVTDDFVLDPLTGDTLPGTDVTFVPIGGTALAIVNVELRTPAPFAADRVRVAWFVDAGALEAGEVWDLRPSRWRITPGVGVRVRSPVGPIRLDIAFNPYEPRRGPLFLALTDTLIRLADDFAPERGSLLDRFRLHLALGQAF
jgi:outer membrane protein assembly factor BamA